MIGEYMRLMWTYLSYLLGIGDYGLRKYMRLT